ncbi:hypothetical protein [Rathayibacter festucae]|uniref:hypothetical protein n=1 Tax=Rathayibacter festucae TaxID=110937 RepID=UPI002A6B82CA|nr:hypothetical protein [Rathayibacter festucae]MDY0914481.1 hypothetical protein [Rathayibacter festucae]
MTLDAEHAPVDSDLSLRAVVMAPPLRREAGGWAFPIAAAGSDRVVPGEVRVSDELQERSRFREHEVWRVEGLVEFSRVQGVALDVDIAPGFLVLHARSAQRVAPTPLG